MSQENVEIVQAIYDAVARRDDITPFEFYAEDIVWDLSHAGSAPLLGSDAIYRGHEGVREHWRDGLAAFSEIRLEVEQLTDEGDQVLAVIREREVGRASRVRVSTTHFALWTLADGEVTRMQLFHDRARALEAVGLAE
jgi:ketosteroid isomerase-like protein